MRAKILVVDDDPTMLKILDSILEDAGYQIELAGNAIEALRHLDNEGPDLIITDIRMPHMDGFEFCQVLRRMTEAPIMLLSGIDKTEADKVRGLKLGADEYMTKPFGVEELVARVDVLLRRRAETDKPAESRAVATTMPEAEKPYTDSVLKVDSSRHEVFVRGTLVDLPPTQFNLLHMLVRSAGKVCKIDDIMEEVWDARDTPRQVVRWHIARLRDQIESKPSKPERLITIRGVGFRYDPPTD